MCLSNVFSQSVACLFVSISQLSFEEQKILILMKLPFCQFLFFYGLCLFVSCLRNLCPVPRCKDHLPSVHVCFVVVALTFQVLDLFTVSFCVWCEITVGLLSYPSQRVSYYSAHFWETAVSPLHYLGTLLKTDCPWKHASISNCAWFRWSRYHLLRVPYFKWRFNHLAFFFSPL